MPHLTGGSPRALLVTPALHCAQQSQGPQWPSCRTKPTARGAQGSSVEHNHFPWGKASSSLLWMAPSQSCCHPITILSGCCVHTDVCMACSRALSLVHLTAIAFGSSQRGQRDFTGKRNSLNAPSSHPTFQKIFHSGWDLWKYSSDTLKYITFTDNYQDSNF